MQVTAYRRIAGGHPGRTDRPAAAGQRVHELRAAPELPRRVALDPVLQHRGSTPPAKPRVAQAAGVGVFPRPLELAENEAPPGCIRQGLNQVAPTERKTTLIQVIAGQPANEASPDDWRHRAACRDEDPELFFPTGNSGPALHQIREAKSVCRRCPVASTCLTWALSSGQDAGVWGGMSEDERRALKRRNRGAAA